MLKLESYQRRYILNNWLEQLRNRHASENLLKALSFLFDDKIAKEVLTLINKRLILKKGKTHEKFNYSYNNYNRFSLFIHKSPGGSSG